MLVVKTMLGIPTLLDKYGLPFHRSEDVSFPLATIPLQC